MDNKKLTCIIRKYPVKLKLPKKGDTRHAIFGEGKIGKEALKRFILHPKIAHIPVIMELPVLSESRELAILDEVGSWD